MGDGDKSFSLETAIKSTELEEKLVVRLVNGAGQAPHQQAAAQVNKLLLTFLSGMFNLDGKIDCLLKYFVQSLRAELDVPPQFHTSCHQRNTTD